MIDFDRMSRLTLRKRLAMAIVVLLLSGIVTSGFSQEYPSRPVRFIIIAAPGGQPDLLARILAPNLTQLLGQPFIVENLPGAGGIAAMNAVMAAPADGHVLLISDSSLWAINPALRPKQPNDFLKNFLPVRMTHTTSVALVVSSTMQVNTLQEFLAIVKSRPGAFSYASAGIGSIHHLTMEAFKGSFGLDIVHVPYKSSGQALPPIVSGELAMMFAGLPSLTPFVNAGRLKVLAVSTKARTRLAPNLPTIAESGAPDFDYAGGGAVLVKTGTPRSIIDRLVVTFDKTYATPEVITRLNANNMEYIAQSTPEHALEIIRADGPRWAAAVKLAGSGATE